MAEAVVDTQFIPWIESKNDQLKFQRVDSELDSELQDDQKELLDKDGESDSDILRNIIKEAINNEKVTIQIQSLKGENAPASMILLPEQMRRINDIGALMEQRLPGLPDHHVLVINKKHVLVEGLQKLKGSAILLNSSGETSNTENLRNDIAIHLYDIAKLSVGGLEPNEIADFQSRNSKLMGKLMEKAL